MTESEWMSCENPEPMLEFLRRRKSTRKQRLFACACCRLVWDRLPLQWRQAVEVSERFADGDASKEEVRIAFDTAVLQAGDDLSFDDGLQTASWACNTTCSAHQMTLGAAYRSYLVRRQAAIVVRDLFRPFHRISPVAEPAWLRWNDATIPRMALQMYDNRDFSNMPILGDAFEEAGCTHADILNHCREPGPHVRGCWLVDLLLNKGCADDQPRERP
jgi:hypothetical protein